jgi:hypothetical protein
MEIQLPFKLSHYLGTLAGGLGFFPLDNGRYHPLSVCRTVLLGIRSLVRFGKACAPLAHPVLYPRGYSYDALPK